MWTCLSCKSLKIITARTMLSCLQLWFYLFIMIVWIDHVEMSTCGYRDSMKCVDMMTVSNDILRKYAEMEDGARLKNIFEHFNFTRIVGSEGHARARSYIVSTFKELGWNVQQDQFEEDTPYGRKTFTNVIASSNPEAATRLLLACHYDSKDYRGRIRFIGATDSAVPCAILIDVGKTLSTNLKEHKNISLDLVFFDGEEAFGEWTSENSIYGAKAMASKWLRVDAPLLTQMYGGKCKRMDSVNGLILLDLIGVRGMRLHNLYAENTCSTAMFDQFNFIENRLQRLGKQSKDLDIFSDGKFYYGRGIEDDHLPFKDAGVNIVHLIAIPFPFVWHQESDHGGNLDWESICNLNTITRIFIVQYFSIDM